MTVEDVWRAHRQWSAVAVRAGGSLGRWRSVNLGLILLGSVLAALATQAGWLSRPASITLGAVSAAALAVAGVVQARLLSAERVRSRLGARAASEALKALTYRYLASVRPFSGRDAESLLSQAVAQVEELAGDDAVLVVGVDADDHPLPAVRNVADYVRQRAVAQRDWHARGAATHRTRAQRWRLAELGATGLAAVLAAVGGAVPGSDLSAWVAVATTLAAAFAAHLATEQHERIAASYAKTVLTLNRLVRDFDPAVADEDQAAQFVTSVESVLATQNDAWVALVAAG